MRLKGSKIGPRLRARVATLIAAGVPRVEISRQERVGRESIRQMEVGPGGELFARWVEVARRRLAAGVPHERIADELCETLDPAAHELEPPTPEVAWEALRSAAAYFGRVCSGWNAIHGDDSLVTCGFLESDPDHLVQLVASYIAHADLDSGRVDAIDVAAFGPGHPDVGRAIRVLLSACINITAHKRDILIGNAACAEWGSADGFLPWKEIAT